MIKKYRKKPVVIEAVQWTGDNFDEINEDFSTFHVYISPDNEENLIIKTLEGNMKCRKGDYIICGVNGEYYPCKPDIFHKTYEEVGDWKDIGQGFPGPEYQTEGWRY